MTKQTNDTLTILVIDDDLPRRELGEQLEGAGFTVLTGCDGEEGYAKLQEEEISLVLVGLALPGQDGPAFCRTIRASGQFRSMPLIFLVDRSELETGLNPFQAGADDFLVRPVDAPELIARIRNSIVKRQAFRRLECQARDSETLLDISRSVNSTLETGEILKQIVNRVATVLDDVFRCSIVYIRRESRFGHVIASSDAADFEPVQIDLDKYPEIREAMTSARPVVIEDIRTSPVMQSVRNHLRSDAFNTIIVLPVIYRKQMVGAMMVRALRSTPGVNDEEVGFCELVANVAANALQNAEYLESVQSESSALRSSHDRLERELGVKAIYELLFESASEGLAAIDSEQRIHFVNRRAMEMTGYSRDELRSMSFLSLMEPDSADRFVAGLATQKTLVPRAQTFDVSIRSGDRTRRILSVSLGERPLSGDLQVLSFRDVTERRQLEQQLLETRSELEKANRRLLDMDSARTEFYNTAAHELRTPVAVVNGYCELLSLSDRSNLNDKQKEYLAQIGRSGERLIDLIHNLLDLSRFEAGKMPIELEENDLSDLIRDIGNEIRSLVDTKGLTIEIHSGPLTMLYFDVMLIRRVLLNLISNAVKHTSEGGRISVVLEEDSREVRVRVCDTGIGIPESEQGRLFKEFSQISTPTGPEGTGLGLAISKKIVEAHDGRIWVDSTPGKGSSFTFSIPKTLSPAS